MKKQTYLDTDYLRSKVLELIKANEEAEGVSSDDEAYREGWSDCLDEIIGIIEDAEES